MVNGGQFGAGLESFAQSLDNHAVGILLPILPLVEFDDHFVAHHGGRLEPALRGISHDDIMIHPRIIRNDVKISRGFLE